MPWRTRTFPSLRACSGPPHRCAAGRRHTILLFPLAAPNLWRVLPKTFFNNLFVTRVPFSVFPNPEHKRMVRRRNRHTRGKLRTIRAIHFCALLRGHIQQTRVCTSIPPITRSAAYDCLRPYLLQQGKVRTVPLPMMAHLEQIRLQAAAGYRPIARCVCVPRQQDAKPMVFH